MIQLYSTKKYKLYIILIYFTKKTLIAVKEVVSFEINLWKCGAVPRVLINQWVVN